MHLPPFDAVRRYVRYGERSAHPLVTVSEEPILADEPVVGRRRLGHLVTVNWAADGVSIVSQVSLFNWVTYRVSLARDLPEEIADLRRGSFFDVASGEILELGARSRS